MSAWNTPLTLTAVEAESTVKLTATGSPTVSGLQYRRSTEDSWSSYTIDTVVTLTNTGDYVQFQNTANALSTSGSNCVKFVMTGKIAASGNTQAMLNYSQACVPACFHSLFESCKALVQAPELPSTQLEQSCYARTFYGCTGLTEAPLLPATVVKYMSYNGMFGSCTSLIYSPDLKADSVATYGCVSMFYGCTSLAKPPALPATMIGTYGYNAMFQSCSSLISTPTLPATTLTGYCYYNMFQGCTSLRIVSDLPATTLPAGAYRQLLSNCSQVSEMTVFFTSWPDSNATENWVSGVAEHGTFYKPKSLPEEYGVNRIPTGWQVVNMGDVECSPSVPTLMDPLGVTVDSIVE